MRTRFFKGGELEVVKKLDIEHRRLQSEYSDLLLARQLSGHAPDEKAATRIRSIREAISFVQEAIHDHNDIVNSTAVAPPPGVSADIRRRAADVNALATVIIVPKTFVKYDDAANQYRLITRDVRSYHELCADEPYASERTARPTGSGILIGASSILTAAHCVRLPLEQLYFVFDFTEDSRTEEVMFDPTDVYEGETILESDPIDWAVVKLKSKVERRQPVRIHQANPIPVGRGVYVIGHPLGMTRKRADGAHVRSGDERIFVANLDVLVGSSGAPVFDASTNKLIGIATDGSASLVQCAECSNGCKRVQTCKGLDCNGEVVVRIAEIGRRIDLTVLP